MKKLLIWDGDETLWRGTLIEGDLVEIAPDRLALCEELSNRGVLQALATRNRLEDVRDLTHRHGLDRWFLHSQADLVSAKSSMVGAIVERYGLSRWSDVVFVDDDPLNLADVADAWPEVTVAPPEAIDDVIAAHFTKPIYTDEDRLRVRRYQSEARREQAAVAYAGDRQAFLRSCAIVMDISIATEADAPRVVDLAKRANRMAALDREYEDDDLWRLIRSGTVAVARVRDRFGDYGLSAFAILLGPEICALVVSCRLQGRGIGSALLGWIVNRVEPRALVRACWTETAYNGGVRGLYEWYGFSIAGASQRVVATLWKQQPVMLPDWIEVRA